MDHKEFQAATIRTQAKFYSGEFSSTMGNWLDIAIHGLAAEAGRFVLVMHEIEEIIHDDVTKTDDALGEVCRYFTKVCTVMKYDLDRVFAGSVIEDVGHLRKLSVKLVYEVTQLNGMIRSSVEKNARIPSEFPQVMVNIAGYIRSIAVTLGIDLQLLYERNIDKHATNTKR